MTLPTAWHLPLEIRARFGQKRSGRQRAMAADGHLLLVLHQAPEHGMRDREGIFFWRRPNGQWEYSGRGSGLKRLIEHVEAYSLAEQGLSQEYSEARSGKDYFHILERVGPLHHAACNLHATLQAAREAIPDDRDIIDLRDWAYDLERTLELLQADTKHALDLHSVQVANRLNVLAAIFFPVTAIASVFGMNLASGLEGSSVTIFWSVLLVGVALGFVTSWWALRGGQT
jgi:hypothetical protein